jgi:hypothetical protein
MSDIVERAEQALNDAGQYWQPAAFGAGALTLMPELIAEVKRLHTWQGLMSLLDEHYPETIFPTTDDDEYRDSGPRIISLLRQVEKLKKDLHDSQWNTYVSFGGMYSGGSDV